MARRGFTLCFLFLVVSFLLLSCGRTQSFVTVDLYEYQCDARNAYCIYNHYWNNNILLLRSKCYQKDGDVFEPHNSTTVISSALKGRKSFCQYEESVIIRERDDCIALYNWSTNSYNTIQLTPYFTYILDFVVCGDNLICTGRGTKGDVVVSVNLISFAVNELDIGTMTILPGIVVGNNDDAMFFVIKEHDVCCMSVKKTCPGLYVQ
ncbi:MAG: hypothetical protein IJR58_02900 [Lachnospiraceae bacterium]|nr:hypothetical protein [Lachnospiraceae bacterium]